MLWARSRNSRTGLDGNCMNFRSKDSRHGVPLDGRCQLCGGRRSSCDWPCWPSASRSVDAASSGNKFPVRTKKKAVDGLEEHHSISLQIKIKHDKLYDMTDSKSVRGYLLKDPGRETLFRCTTKNGGQMKNRGCLRQDCGNKVMLELHHGFCDGFLTHHDDLLTT